MDVFKPFKGRTVAPGQKVKVYRNLHKHCYSVADAKTGKVLGYADTVTLQTAMFKVSDAGRLRVLQEKQKNVHAFVIGRLVSFEGDKHSQRDEAYYNPYKTRRFMRKTAGGEVTLDAVLNAGSVTLTQEGVYYTGSY